MEPAPCNVLDHVVAMFNGVLNMVQVIMVAWLAKRAVTRDAVEKAANGSGRH